MYSHTVHLFLFGYILCVKGYEEFSSAGCLIEGVSDCSQYIMCSEKEEDKNVFPGRIKTVIQDFYIPSGLTLQATIHIDAPSDMSVIISNAYLAHQDNGLIVENGTYVPHMTVMPGDLMRLSSHGKFHFGDINCQGTRALINIVTEPVTTPIDVSESVTPNSTIFESSTDTVTSLPTDPADVSTSTESLNPADSINATSYLTSTYTSTTEPCTYCLLKLAVEYLMANIDGVSHNSTREVNTALTSQNVTMDVTTTFVFKLEDNASTTSNYSIDIPDREEFQYNTYKKVQIIVAFQNPLSSYKLTLLAGETYPLIATLMIKNVGKIYEDLLEPIQEDWTCSGGEETHVFDFGYMPNKGAYNSTYSYLDYTAEVEVTLAMISEATVGQIYPFDIKLEVDSIVIRNSTIYFNVSDEIPIASIDITPKQYKAVLPKSDTGQVTLTWNVPPLTNGLYEITSSSKRHSGAGGDGLYIAGVQIAKTGDNNKCVAPSTHWKSYFGKMTVRNTGNIENYEANIFGFIVHVMVLPDIAEAGSSHELTTNIIYPGVGSPQSIKFYFNITNGEIFINLPLPLNVYLYDTCRSITHSSNVDLILHTSYHARYGRLFVELPMPTGAMGQSFTLCNFRIKQKGRNINGRFFTTFTRDEHGMIEKVLLDIAPLTNIFFASFDGLTVNYVTMNMDITFINQSILMDSSTISFKPRLISNNKTIWMGDLPITKPSIEYYPNFIVMTAIEKISGVTATNLWYHYSLNGTYYFNEEINWRAGSNVYSFEIPKVIAYFYIATTTPCKIICNVTTVWTPFTDYVTIIKDYKNILLRMLPYALDQDLDTCFDMPLPGDSPSKLWIRFIQLSLFDVTSKKYEIHIKGEGIECARVGLKSLQVGTSGSATNGQCSIDSNIAFCKLLSSSTAATITQCNVLCECETQSKCSDVHIIMQSTNSDAWRLCEITMNDVI